MKTLDELLAFKLKQTREKYYEEIKSIKKNIVKEYMINILKDRVNKQLPDCNTTSSLNHLSIHLNSKHNISKDFMLFLENNEDYIKTIGKSEEYEFVHDQANRTYDYKWKDFKIWVYYGVGNCKRVKIGSKTKTVTEDIYEVQCL